jgi:hypothetical protein
MESIINYYKYNSYSTNDNNNDDERYPPFVIPSNNNNEGTLLKIFSFFLKNIFLTSFS